MISNDKMSYLGVGHSFAEIYDQAQRDTVSGLVFSRKIHHTPGKGCRQWGQRRVSRA